VWVDLRGILVHSGAHLFKLAFLIKVSRFLRNHPSDVTIIMGIGIVFSLSFRVDMLCLHSSSKGSCPRHAAEGSIFCTVHCDEAERIKGYLINDAALKERFDHHSEGNLYSVRQEITLLRAMINSRLDLARNDVEKIIAFKEIGPWIATLDKLVNSLAKLEKESSQVLTREALLDFARLVINVVSSEIKTLPGYEQAVDAIKVKLIEAVSMTNNKIEAK
jgi:hypothetical protein